MKYHNDMVPSALIWKCMSMNTIARAIIAPFLLALAFTFAPVCTVTGQTGCCKVCTVGKACGNSCISAAYTCHKGPGCACDSSASVARDH